MDKDRKVRGAAGEVVNPGRGEFRVEREKEIERERDEALIIQSFRQKIPFPSHPPSFRATMQIV
jgi:hypothetical protein